MRSAATPSQTLQRYQYRPTHAAPSGASRGAQRRAPRDVRDVPAGRHRQPTTPVGPTRLALACGVLCCLGLVAAAESRNAIELPAERPVVAASLVDDATRLREDSAASRSRARVSPSTGASPTAVAKPSPTPSKAPAPAKTTATPKATTTAKPTPAKTATPTVPVPVADLTQAQMNNAATIVKVGQKLGFSRWGMIVAVATAMQESSLYNLASDVLPESYDYPHEGSGSDHDSVGIFQQRPSSGWGTVADLMRPAYAAEQFYNALANVDGWANMALTEAAQAVQVSAYPDAYAKHEDRATTVVDALLG
jgi:hypothetical protein